jgi:hypothetical protein
MWSKDLQYENAQVDQRCDETLQQQVPLLWANPLYIRVFCRSGEELIKDVV